jgi:nicotinate-nucleotide adenylyltransferase
MGLGLGREPPRRVGLLGGSFNPAHAGHRHISLEALKRLDLDAVWWLVSPQNPLKPARGMAAFARRLAAAREVARHPRIAVVDLEARLGTRYTVDTLRALGERFTATRFVWLMGADILPQLPRWKRWSELFMRVPVAVFARPSYCHKGLAGMAVQRFARHRVPPAAARRLAEMKPPAWTFFWVALEPSSGTALRTRPQRPARGVRNKTRAHPARNNTR